MIIEIRAGADRQETLREMPRGWLYSTVGPLLTLMQVRTSTQVARSEVEVGLLKEKWREVAPHESFVFLLKSEAPLSWKLSTREKKAIRDGWEKSGNVVESLRKWFLRQ